ncbi:amino acid adenylation domain-containing protein [Lentzea sp. JNUCC 0626]|uniref:non-ribosomal peptide synthetase n=1 Tax=Lentzea sp. JNUCC 0626 TaxID=3367513 RepID=UPI0037499ACE
MPAEIHCAISGTGRLSAALAAVQVKVVSVLTGERTVSLGHRTTAGDEPRPALIAVRDGSWLDLIEQCDQAARNTGFDSGAAECESVLDLAGWSGEVSRRTGQDGPALMRILTGGGHSASFRLKYREDEFDEELVGRIAGYCTRALDLLVADSAASHNARSLVSPDELAAQLRDLSGVEGELPAKRFHELFAEQAAVNPDASAVRCGDQRWTYRELDESANRVARGLLAHGLTAEGVVAVNLTRSAEWVAVIIGVFRAGGVYLPVDPDWPLDRLRGIVRQARAQVVLVDQVTEGVEDAVGEPATGGARVVPLDAVLADSENTDPGVAVRADQLAYIYFTSGSTGAPKGAMCEHAGMMNHLLAKLEDLGITSGDVVLQNAPATFDISLWQAIAPLLVGASTTVVPADVVRDVDAFLAEADDAGATVMQVVPSYLDVLTARLAEIEPGRRLPTVRHVVVTGEALKKGLVQRWFDLCDIPLTNAYGATEASDDTTHHTLHRPPDSASVPVGGPVRNVQIFVVDEHLQVLPAGAPGEIVFAGVCVGRGYVNDAERTAAAFVQSRTEPPMRLYRTGDYGRWGADGVLEFHGRRDEQIKVRGFRVELGEIENAMLRVAGVRDAAVVVRRDIDPDAGLVGYYTSAPDVEAGTVRAALAEVLPEYMVPVHLFPLSAMPLTTNSKIDKKALADLPVHQEVDRTDRTAGWTDTEEMLAGVWAELLGLSASAIDRHDHFFARGGSSLSAIRLVVKLGNQVSLRDVASSPVLSELAEIVDQRNAG